MSKSHDYSIVMSNTGGPLDTEIVTVHDGEDEGQIIKAKLLAMIEGAASIEPGDTFTVASL